MAYRVKKVSKYELCKRGKPRLELLVSTSDF